MMSGTSRLRPRDGPAPQAVSSVKGSVYCVLFISLFLLTVELSGRFGDIRRAMTQGSRPLLSSHVAESTCIMQAPAPGSAETGVGLLYTQSAVDASISLEPENFDSPNITEDVVAATRCLETHHFSLIKGDCDGTENTKCEHDFPDVLQWRDRVSCSQYQELGGPWQPYKGNFTIVRMEAGFVPKLDEEMGAAVYSFPQQMPVIFWNRTRAGASYNMLHGTSSLFVLFRILESVGLVSQSGAINRHNQIVTIDQQGYYRLGMFKVHMRAMTSNKMIYSSRWGTEPVPQGPRSMAICAASAVVAKEDGVSAGHALDLDRWGIYTDQNEDPEAAKALSRFVSVIVQHAAVMFPQRFVGVLPEWAEPKAPRIIFLLRKPPTPEGENKRIILNEKELRSKLQSPPGFPGVEFVTFSDKSFEDQLEYLLTATVLIGIHGTDMVSVLYLPRGAVVLELYPDQWTKKYHIYGNMARLTGKLHRLVEYTVDQGLSKDQQRAKDFNPHLNVTVVESAIAAACRLGINARFWPDNGQSKPPDDIAPT